MPKAHMFVYILKGSRNHDSWQENTIFLIAGA
jgi:hypothetical protein